MTYTYLYQIKALNRARCNLKFADGSREYLGACFFEQGLCVSNRRAAYVASKLGRSVSCGLRPIAVWMKILRLRRR